MLAVAWFKKVLKWVNGCIYYVQGAAAVCSSSKESDGEGEGEGAS